MRYLPALICLLPAVGAAQFVPIAGADPNECDYSTISRGQDSNMAIQQMSVITSANGLRSVWTSLTGQPSQAAPNKEIQWGRQHAIIVSLGDQPEGTTLNVGSIRRQNGRWVVKAYNNPPLGGGGGRGRGGNGGGRTSRPWALIAVERKVSNPVLAVTRAEPTVILNPGWGGGGYNPGWGGGGGFPQYPDNSGNCPYIVYRSGGNCAVTRESVIIISTPGLFVGWYNDSLGFRDRPQLPQIDWTSERMVALHAGQLEDRNLVLSVKGIRRTTKGLVVDAKLVRGQGAGNPWALVRVPAGDEKVELVIEKE
ncbi:hypothetical protein EON81_16680 [bacterium]|nr:MAG: hypothetical protein EON81_16680 [bacterium]